MHIYRVQREGGWTWGAGGRGLLVRQDWEEVTPEAVPLVGAWVTE